MRINFFFFHFKIQKLRSIENFMYLWKINCRKAKKRFMKNILVEIFKYKRRKLPYTLFNLHREWINISVYYVVLYNICFQICLKYIESQIGKNAPPEIQNVEKLINYIFLLGEFAQAAPTCVTKNDVKMLENILLSPRKREGLYELQSIIHVSKFC